MEGLRQYVISVAAAAILCGIVTGLFRNGMAKEIFKLVCGLFLAYTAVAPIAKWDFSELLDFRFYFEEDAAAAAALGEELALSSKLEIIKSQTEAYILDKANEMDADISAEVTVDDDGIPVAVALTGQASPYARSQIQTIIESDLGIAKENQQWTG